MRMVPSARVFFIFEVDGVTRIAEDEMFEPTKLGADNPKKVAYFVMSVYHHRHTFSSYGFYCIGEKSTRKGLVRPQAWHTGDVSVSAEPGEACELARITRAQQARFLAYIYARKHMERTCGIGCIIYWVVDLIFEC